MNYVTVGEEVIQKLYEDIADLTHDKLEMEALLKDLLDPEGYGYAVTQEVRDRARRILSELRSGYGTKS